MEQNYLAGQENHEHRGLRGRRGLRGSDYLLGFDTGDDSMTEFLESLIDNGYVPHEDMEELTKASMFINHDQFYDALSRAYKLMEEASFNDPLEGQDPLTFLAKVLPYNESDGEEKKGDKNNGKEEKVEEELGPVQFDVQQDQYRRSQHAAMNPPPAPAGAKKPTVPLAYTPTAYSRRRASKTPPLIDGQESVSGPGTLLPSLTPPLTSMNNEAGESSKESQQPTATPGDSKSLSDRVEINPEMHQTTSLETDTLDPLSQPQNQTPKRTKKSHYFDTIDTPSPTNTKSSRPPRGTIPCIPFPRLDAPQFGLIQEELSSDPFRLLIAVTFLIRVKGKHAIPVFRELMAKYPTPSDLANADTNDILALIRHLGLASTRAAAFQKYARIWTTNPPRADVRYGVKNYPSPGDGADVRMGEALTPDDPRLSAWEIGHMTQGRYAIDSWRIFCRDTLLGKAQDWRGKGREGEFQPEWMRVLPQDKELRACLRWLWMQEGWAWDPKTGEKEILPEDLRLAVDEGRVAYDDMGELRILDKEEVNPV